jgi:hypothetical protein
MELRSIVEQLKTLYIGRARGNAIDSERYAFLREAFLTAVGDGRIPRPRVPAFILECVTVDEFWW